MLEQHIGAQAARRLRFKREADKRTALPFFSRFRRFNLKLTNDELGRNKHPLLLLTNHRNLGRKRKFVRYREHVHFAIARTRRLQERLVRRTRIRR